MYTSISILYLSYIYLIYKIRINYITIYIYIYIYMYNILPTTRIELVSSNYKLPILPLN